MANITIVFGGLLILLGVGFYVPTEAPTALIPAYFGIALVILGLLARNEKLRMHVMHVAALVGLIGFAMPAVMVIKGLTIDGKSFGSSMAEQTTMSAICAAFLGLCIKSFINSRIAHKRREAGTQVK